ncbi:MAG: HPr(Ser) kinase/phosphatase [Clostridiaceae bacterium]|nr:HPr(Ser) kinase/phosphatase [Clostridiaceae bacterium]
MAQSKYSVEMHQLVSEFHLDVRYGPEDYLNNRITSAIVNRPALPLTGFFEYFNSNSIQVIGKAESFYLRSRNRKERLHSMEMLLSAGVPLLIFANGEEPEPEYLELAEKHKVTIAVTPEVTSSFIAALTASLNVYLGPRLTMHGVFVEVYGEGILLLGDSGIGKSETAIELVKRGHRLVADDAVDIKRVSAKSLVGSAPEIIRYFIELRGIGVIDVRRIFGMGAVKPTEKVDLIIRLHKWEDGKPYDRMGIEQEYTDILGIQVPSLEVPVRPGRNLAVIIEVAAMNNRNRKMGQNAAKELSDKQYASLLAQQEGPVR